MYQDEHEEVIHDTLEDKADEILSEHLLVKHLRAMIKQEVDKKFDEQPTSYNSFKKEEMEELINNKLENFLEDSDLREKIIDEVKGLLDDSFVEVNTTSYITY